MNTVHSMPVVIFVALLGGFLSYLLSVRYAGLRGGNAVVAAVVTLVAATSIVAHQINRYTGPHFQAPNWRVMISTLCVGLFVILTSAFCIRLYRKWLGGDLTEEERAPGRRGLHAWLSPSNVVVAALVSVSAWQGFNCSLVLMLALTFGALVIWPLLRADTATAGPVAPVTTESYPREREKVLALLEAGKITAEESAELLHALAASPSEASLQKPGVPRSPLGLIGTALVLVGFFLPWFTFSPAEELAATVADFQRAMPLPMLEMAQSLPSQKVSVRGGDIGKGLGWAVLVLAIASFVLPTVAKDLDRSTLRTFRVLTLLAGGIIVVYLLSQDIKAVNIGLVLVLIGYGCAGIALWREEGASWRAHRAAEAGV